MASPRSRSSGPVAMSRSRQRPQLPAGPRCTEAHRSIRATSRSCSCPRGLHEPSPPERRRRSSPPPRPRPRHDNDHHHRRDNDDRRADDHDDRADDHHDRSDDNHDNHNHDLHHVASSDDDPNGDSGSAAASARDRSADACRRPAARRPASPTSAPRCSSPASACSVRFVATARSPRIPGRVVVTFPQAMMTIALQRVGTRASNRDREPESLQWGWVRWRHDTGGSARTSGALPRPGPRDGLQDEGVRPSARRRALDAARRDRRAGQEQHAEAARRHRRQLGSADHRGVRTATPDTSTSSTPRRRSRSRPRDRCTSTR